MPELSFNGHPADVPKPYDHAQDRDHARVADRQDHDSDPSTLRRLVPVGVVAAGAAAVIAAGTLIEGPAKSVAESVYSIFFHGAQVTRELDQPIGKVKHELRDGEISASDVVEVTVDAPISTYGEAVKLAGNDHNANPVAYTIEKQQGDNLSTGDEVVLPAGSIDSQPNQK